MILLAKFVAHNENNNAFRNVPGVALGAVDDLASNMSCEMKWKIADNFFFSKIIETISL